MNTWPLQSQCVAYYGDPTVIIKGSPRANAAWESANLVTVFLPWQAHASWDKDLRIRTLRVHKKVADSLKRVLDAVWSVCGHSQAEIDRIGMSSIGGGYIWRVMRGGRALSMHSYGCAVDFDPANNDLGDQTPAMDPRVVAAFEAEGWTWGGRWAGSGKDGMHFQAARVS